uniref:Uncharacterized protein n=1 Tax=Manihot esculenta TaxID=3983 RepID=A0A2C9VZP9_MANES
MRIFYLLLSRRFSSLPKYANSSSEAVVVSPHSRSPPSINAFKVNFNAACCSKESRGTSSTPVRNLNNQPLD